MKECRRRFPIAFLILLLTAALTGRPGRDSGQASILNPASAPATRCSILHTNQNWWLATPNGRPFFSLGVCCVNRGLSREEFDAEAPG